MLRPVFNFSLGRVESQATATPPAAQASSSRAALDFLGNGRLNATGVGGSLMLDYERYRPENEVDLELRYTNIHLQSFDSSQAVEGHANAQTVSLWSRYRAPTGFTALERPLRYVLEYAYTSSSRRLERRARFRRRALRSGPASSSIRATTTST